MIAKGVEGFKEYYKDYLEVLGAVTQPILRIRPAYRTMMQAAWQKAGLSWQTLDWYHDALLWPATIPVGTVLPGYNEHWFYVMNASSLKPVLALNPQPTEYILDACAAPGGKTLFMADLLGSAPTLVANDPSPARRQRLHTVLQDYGHSEVQITPYKAETIFKKQPQQYDAILLDAPCSSEKHVWQSPKHLAQWSLSRIKRLQHQQIALINGLWLALKPGGRLVYVTCALNRLENEAVIQDFQKRHPEAIVKDQQRITPDTLLYDPMFYAVIEQS